MQNQPTYETLKAKACANRDAFTDILRERVRRSLSWIGRAEKEVKQGDPDAAFIFYWIALNATYAQGRRERKYELGALIGKIVRLDKCNRIHNLIWTEFSGSISSLLNNPYVYQPFWDYHHKKGKPNWKQGYDSSWREVSCALNCQDTEATLGTLFDRLYTLRNQLMHGGATWNRCVNRDQVRDGARIMEYLVPWFLWLMMDDPKGKWGNAYYPSREILP